MRLVVQAPPRARALAFYTIIYIFVGALSLSTNYMQSNTATVWIPAGFSTGLLVARGIGFLPAIALGSFILNTTVNILYGTTSITGIAVAAFVAIGNTGEALLGWYLAERYADGTNLLLRLRNVFAFAIAAIFPPMISAVCGIAASYLGGLTTTSTTFEVFSTWYSANTLGILIFAAPTIAALTPIRTSRPATRKIVEFAILLVVLAFVTQAMSGIFVADDLQEWPRSYMIIPVLLWAAVRFGTLGALTAILLVTAMSVIGTMRGFEVFPADTNSLSLTFLQLFLALISVVTLSISAGLSEVAELRTDLENRVRVRSNDVDRLLRSRELLTNLVAHDMQGPIYGLRNALRAAGSAINADRMTTSEIASAITTMDQTCSDLATRLMTYLDAGGFEPIVGERVNVHELVETIRKRHSRAMLERKADLVWRGDRTITVQRPQEAEHVIETLIINALTYGFKGSPIEIAAFRHGGNVEVHVSNRGDGVRNDEIAALFSLKMRAARRARNEEGGLGLFLASEQAQELGGRLTYAFTPPDAVTFRLVLPL